MCDDLVAEFDGIIADAPVDFVGTSSDGVAAEREEREWLARVADFRESLIELRR